MKLVGFENVDYINKSGNRITGARLYCTYDSEKIVGSGMKTLFLGAGKIERNKIDLNEFLDSELVLIQNDYGSLEKIEKKNEYSL